MRRCDRTLRINTQRLRIQIQHSSSEPVICALAKSDGAPITIVIVLVVGLHFVLHLDYAVRFHSAEIATRMEEQEIETAAMYTARDQMVEEMGSTAHTEKIRQAAADKVTNIIEFIAAKKRA